MLNKHVQTKKKNYKTQLLNHKATSYIMSLKLITTSKRANFVYLVDEQKSNTTVFLKPRLDPEGPSVLLLLILNSFL